MPDDPKPQDQLSEIHRFLSEARRDDPKRGRQIFLLWGVLTAAASIACCVMGASGVREDLAYALVWVIHNAIGWACSFALKAKSERETGRDSYKGRILGSTWAMLNAAIWLVIFQWYGPGWIRPEAINPLISILLGTGVFVTGLVAEVSALRVVGAGMAVVGAILPGFIPPQHVFVFSSLLNTLPFVAFGLGALMTRKKA